MKKARKLLITLLILTFVLSTVSVGFAATTSFSDVKDANVADAVTRLSALDILNGYPDGTFKPDNQITRAEFAKIIVSAVGVGKAAEYAKGTTQFKDVPADYWASGYIKVASDMKIVNGRGNGVFDPNANVTYAEAITMIVRALGYEPKAQALGGYPGGYLAIAAEKGITDNVNVVNTLSATRGDVAKMVNNSLDVNLMEQTGFGTNTTYEEVNKTLLTSKLSTKEYKDYRVVATPKVDSKLDKDEIKMEDKDGNVDTYTVADYIKADDLFGLKLTAWEKDSKIIFVDYDKAQLVNDMLAAPSDSTDVYASDAKELKLIAADDSYDLAKDAVVYVDHAKAKLSDLKKGQYGRFVLDKGDIVFVDVVNAESGMDGIIVKGIDEKEKTISYIYDGAEKTDLDLSDADEYHIYLNGAEIDLADVKEDDVLYVAKIDDKFFITDVRNTVEGKLEKAKNSSATIDGKSYDAGLVATASQDNDDSVNAYNADNVKDLISETVIAILDMNGQIRHIRGDVNTTSDDMYGIVVKGQNYYDSLKVYVNGETKTYDVKRGTSDVPSTTNLDTLNGEIIKFTLNKDGKINSISLETPTPVSAFKFDKDNDAITDTAATPNVLAFVTSSTEFVRSDSYTPDSGTTYTGFDTDSLDVLKWDDIKSKTPSGNAYIVTNSKNEALYVVFEGASAFTESKAGVVLDKYRTTDGWVAKVDVFDGGEKEYVLNSSTGLYSNLSKGDVITFNVNADNELVLASGDIKFDASDTATYNTSVMASVYSRDGRYIKFTAAGNIYKVTDKTLVYKIKFDSNNKYDTIEKSSYTKISAGMPVFYITGDANTLKVIAYEVTDATTPSTPTPAYDATLKQQYIEGDATILLDVNGTVKPYEMATTWYIDAAAGITLNTDASGNIIIPQGAKIKFTLVEGTQKVGYIEVVQLP